ncbi:S8 family serine peptidase [Micromonospora sp. NPDC018662]|uniref:S8 family serine peptidase n=1 Tax=Micromonospora sp. NPDC018662 TaxID=3364238 RepID=UPI0037996790
MPVPPRHPARAGAACAAAALVTGLHLVTPVTPAAADDGPPALPSAVSGCVGPSPTRYGERVPWPVARMAPYLTRSLSQGRGVRVAVLDSGVSGAAAGLGAAVAPGRDVVSGGPARSDCLGRGTALAAIVAARPTPGTGVVGMAPEATVLPIRIIGPRHRLTPTSLADGIDAAVDAGAGVVLLGTGQVADTPALRAAVIRAAERNVLVVAPVDDGPAATPGRPPPVWYPAAYPQVLAVGGVDANGRSTVPAPPASGLDLLAPGKDAIAPGPTGAGHYVVDGTAVAAAHVAGTAALVRGYHPELTAEQVRDRLVRTAERAPFAAAGTVDPYAALTTLDPDAAARPVRLDAEPVSVATAPPADPAIARAGLVAAVVTVAALLISAGVWIRRGRRRPANRWSADTGRRR